VMYEPLDSLEGGYHLIRRRDSLSFVPEKALRQSDGQRWIYFYRDDSPGALRTGDWIKLTYGGEEKFRDKARNAPAAANPWTEIKGGLVDQIRFSVVAVKPVAKPGEKSSGATPYGGNWPKKSEPFRIHAVEPSTGREIHLATGNRRLQGQARDAVYDTSDYGHLGPVFEIEVQMPQALLMAAGQPIWDFEVTIGVDLFDNIGQFVNKTSYTFVLSKLGRDLMADDGTLRLLLEWTVPEGAGAPLAQDGRGVGSGAYIGSFQFSAKGDRLIADEQAPQKIKSEDTQQILFGIWRGR